MDGKTDGFSNSPGIRSDRHKLLGSLGFLDPEVEEETPWEKVSGESAVSDRESDVVEGESGLGADTEEELAGELIGKLDLLEQVDHVIGSLEEVEAEIGDGSDEAVWDSDFWSRTPAADEDAGEEEDEGPRDREEGGVADDEMEPSQPSGESDPAEEKAEPGPVDAGSDDDAAATPEAGDDKELPSDFFSDALFDDREEEEEKEYSMIGPWEGVVEEDGGEAEAEVEAEVESEVESEDAEFSPFPFPGSASAMFEDDSVPDEEEPERPEEVSGFAAPADFAPLPEAAEEEGTSSWFDKLGIGESEAGSDGSEDAGTGKEETLSLFSEKPASFAGRPPNVPPPLPMNARELETDDRKATGSRMGKGGVLLLLVVLGSLSGATLASFFVPVDHVIGKSRNTIEEHQVAPEIRSEWTSATTIID